MSYYSKLIYQIDRVFLTFIEKIVNTGIKKAIKKFYIDIVYGILKSKSIVISSIAYELNEETTLKKTIDRLIIYLDSSINPVILHNYKALLLSKMPQNTLKIFCVDDTDVIKPYGKKFENLGRVKDGSAKEIIYEKGYRVTSIIGLTEKTKHPLPFINEFHSETQPGYNSINEVTHNNLKGIINYLEDYTSVFVFDRGYDDNKMFKFFKQNRQYFVIRLTKKRSAIIKRKKIKIIELCKRKKGKIIIPVTYKSEKLIAKASHMQIELINHKEMYYLIFVYLEEAKEPMMLLTNKKIESKNDVIQIVMYYTSRWKIEEHFRFKKYEFGFENFRVRKFNGIKHLSFCLDIAISFLSILIESQSKIYYEILSNGKGLRTDSYLKLYQVISGITNILGHKQNGIREKEQIRKRTSRCLTLFDI